ncbi:hypothetical protein QWA68_016644 [Fusarium oxysporum]|nr:hypothetical protein QWA68_016644 [Fusarium oxysporum]
MAHALSNLNEQNCGALYLASSLLCFCTLAAGPTGPNDLLVCITEDVRSTVCVPMIRGVRLIRQLFPLETLFAGLMAPMNIAVTLSTHWRPRWMEAGLPCLDWEEAVNNLRTLVMSHHADNDTSRVNALNQLEGIYEALYGKKNGNVSIDPDPASRFVLTWLYRIDDKFIENLQRRDSDNLLMLAHWAPLLSNYRDEWFFVGWTEQLVLAVRALLPEHLVAWMQWPLEAIGILSPDAPSREDGEE